MKLAQVSIRRPIFTAMMIAAVVVVGLQLYFKLSVDRFPETTFPVVTVTVVYPGADPLTMETKVADPIEEAVNSLSGVKMLGSTSQESVCQVFVQFQLDVNFDAAAQDVRDRVASIQRKLPDQAEPPQIDKLDMGAAPIMNLALSGPLDIARLSDFAENVLKPGLERVNGVGQLELIGSREPEMHVWVDPDRLRAYGLTVHEVVQAIGIQNVEIPGGRLTRGGQELVIRTDARARSVASMEELPLVTMGDAIIRLGDVARVVDGLEESRSRAVVNGEPAIAIIVRKQSDANTVQVADRVREALPELQARAPAGTKLAVTLDESVAIRGSIDAVKLDLLLGAVLAVSIIFLFLRDVRATFISALALPTSVIGTFAFVSAMGFTLNMMTTLALSLSIGILIDDAIVVIENIVRHRTILGEGARTAADRGTSEIGLAVLATTMSIVAVFIPVAFMEGMVGQFFYEFGLTVAFAVLLSLFVSFTLTPMLSARLLKGHGESHGVFYNAIESFLRGLESIYRLVIRFALRQRTLTMVLAIASLVGAFSLLPKIGFEFVPPEDRGLFKVVLELPSGTALEETAEVAFAAAHRVKQVPGVVSTFTTVGGGVQEKVNTAEILVELVHKSQRSYSQQDAMAYMRRLLKTRPDLVVAAEQLQMVSNGAFRSSPIQFDIRGSNLEELERVATKMADRLRAMPGYADVDIDYRAGKPELNVLVDRQRAADLAVPGVQVASTVRTLLAGQVAGEYQIEGDRYDIRVQLPPELRRSTAVLGSAQVRSTGGQLVDIDQVAELKTGTGPSLITRRARQRQVTVLANLEGKALGNAMAEIDVIAAEEVPEGLFTKWSGFGEVMGESNASMATSLMLAVIFIYMILASQFESLLHPFTIMVSLPFSLIGAFGGLLLAKMHMSIFAMIGLIMLMGLVTKNAILLVDFAIQLRQQGKDRLTALEEAGAVRLRPILMTTAAMVFGMIPVAIGHGDGGEVRAPMGVTVIGGLLTSTVLTLIVVPVVYTFFDTIGAFFGRLTSRLVEQEHDQEAPVAAE